MGCERGGEPAANPCGEPGILASTMARWRPFTASLQELPVHEKRPRIESFLSTISMDDVRAVCCQGADSSDVGTTRFLRRLTRAKLEYDPPSIEGLVAFVRDTTLATICRDIVVRVAQDRRDDMTPAEGNALSDALLDRADLAVDPEDMRRLELWAPQFGTTDRVISRVRAYLASDEGELRRHGISMAVESTDPRAADLLIDLLREVVETRPDHADEWREFVLPAARGGQSRALPLLEQLAFGSGYDPDLRHHALRSIGWVHDPASMRLLLRAYGDGGDVHDSTWALPFGERRDRYQDLHLASRALEPFLLDRLRSGPPEQALDAYALIVRAVRFGYMGEPSRATEALQVFAGRDLGVEPEHIQDTVARASRPRPGCVIDPRRVRRPEATSKEPPEGR